MPSSFPGVKDPCLEIGKAVATEAAHLHRLPFSVNEKTGRVAVPFVLAPPFEGLPRAMEDMPMVDDPEDFGRFLHRVFSRRRKQLGTINKDHRVSFLCNRYLEPFQHCSNFLFCEESWIIAEQC